MVDTDLTSATDSLVGLVTELDIVALVTGVSGLGIGLFSAEFVAQFANSIVNPDGRVMTFVTEIVAKGLATGGFAFARSAIQSPLIMVLLGLAAVGSATSAVLQVIEAVAETAARIASGEDLSGSAPVTNGETTIGDATEVTQDYSPSANGSSGAQADVIA